MHSNTMYNIARKTPESFTRERDMPLPLLIASMINMISRTTSVELYNFFTKILNKKSVSKQAFSFARGNLNAEVFCKLNEIFLEEYYEEDYKTYKDYLIFAVDGTGLEIPKTEELVKEFGCPENQKGKSVRPVASSSILFDIENGNIINGVIKPYAYSEQAMALEHIDAIKNNSNLSRKKIIILFDRIYPSMKLMAILKENNIDFIMRSKKSYIKETNVAGKYPNYNKVKNIKITKDMTQKTPWFKSFAKDHEYKMKIRISTGKFSNDEIGIFLTSLDEKEFNREEIVELYRSRWKIETNFRHQKETGEFENFASKTKLRIQQEYFSKIYTLNLANLLIVEAQADIDEQIKKGKIKSKYKLKINQNVAFGIVKNNLIRFILGHEDESFLINLISQIAKHRIPFIEGRIFKRKFHGRKRRHNIPYRRAC